MAMRQLAALIARNNIIPIIEPVVPAPRLQTSLDAFVEAEMLFCLVVNPMWPRRDAAALTPAQVHEQIVLTFLDEVDNFFPTMYVDEDTTLVSVEEFIERYEPMNLDRVYFLTGEPRARVLEAMVNDDPTYIAFGGNVADGTRDRFPLERRVLIEDRFKRVRNSDYPPQEFFSDRHRTIPNADYSHFGDYSIVGADFQEGGAAPYAVAIHHMIVRGAAEHLYLKHYISDSNATQTDTGGKFLEALEKLIADLPTLGAENETSATHEYIALHGDQHYPGLGHLKRLGIKQHVEVLSRLL